MIEQFQSWRFQGEPVVALAVVAGVGGTFTRAQNALKVAFGREPNPQTPVVRPMGTLALPDKHRNWRGT